MSKTTSDTPRKRPFWRRLLRYGAWAALLLLLIAGLALLWLRAGMKASLPRLAGEVVVDGIQAPVTIERDALGIPTLRAANRDDVAYALGFAHAQDRFFQMDMQRRQAAGELAELLGTMVLSEDRGLRIHGFRRRAAALLAASPPSIRSLLQAYSAGVNAGLTDLGESPFEYLVLRAEPAPWRAEDTFLTLFAMFHLLQSPGQNVERDLGMMEASLPRPLFEFLTPQGSSWDAPLLGQILPSVPIPGPEVFDLRQESQSAGALLRGPVRGPASAQVATASLAAGGVPAPLMPPAVPAGSNLWALAGEHTAGGGALLANDMHLALSLPNIWYRAVFSWPGAEGGADHRITGVTLPGAPLMVVGSNGHLAWGFTHASVDTGDLVPLDADPATGDAYSTPEGQRTFGRSTEVLRVKGGEEETLEVASTVWGPVLEAAHFGRRWVWRWIAHEPEAVNFELLGMETARTVEEALAVTNRSGMPAQNVIVASASGRIGWSIAGRLPRRTGCGGRVPGSWADGACSWQGLLPPEQAPRIVDPESGRLWAANNRLVEGEALALLGNDGYAFGARARQIRDRLRDLEGATVEDMLALQLDDRALFLESWHELFLRTLTPEAVAADPRRQEFRDLIEDWDGRAAVDSVAYRLVRDARRWLAYLVFEPLTAACKEKDPRFIYSGRLFYLLEEPLWRLITERPRHLLSPDHATWDDQLLAAIDAQLDHYQKTGESLGSLTWGSFNTVSLRHPFSWVVPGVGRWLDTPSVELPGDVYMPRLQTPRNGASQRMVVSPGREAEGIFHMPGGQSGHPFSPHYRDGHQAWIEGRATPYLPGPPSHQLRLLPSG